MILSAFKELPKKQKIEWLFLIAILIGAIALNTWALWGLTTTQVWSNGLIIITLVGVLTLRRWIKTLFLVIAGLWAVGSVLFVIPILGFELRTLFTLHIPVLGGSLFCYWLYRDILKHYSPKPK